MSKLMVESWEQLAADEMTAMTLDPMDDPMDDLGIVYEEWEELDCGGVKDFGRDLHRWELDPASAEDYFDRYPARLGPSQRWRHFGH
jgi:hypothetical protein